MTFSKELLKAITFMVVAHQGQTRKFNYEPYATHPLRVAQAVNDMGANDHVIIAALLHDVVEDTDYAIDDIVKRFGNQVALLVMQLTNPKIGKRVDRKKAEVMFAIHMLSEAKVIRLADIADNMPSIMEHDTSEFTQMYLTEKRVLYPALVGSGAPDLENKVYKLLFA